MVKPQTTNPLFLVACAVLLLFIIITVFCIPRPNDDLYIALAAGRDIVAGNLTKADSWAFSTQSQVWMNQNWGADLILFLTFQLFGTTGLLVLKFLLLALCAFFLYLTLRQRAIPPTLSILIAGLIIAAMNVYAILRPNLFTLTLIPLLLWLLMKSSKRPAFIWLAVLTVALWSNVHGGFIFGLGMLLLWVACNFVPALIKEKGQVWKKQWQLLAGAGAVLLLVCFANPFGLKNIIFPFLMLRGSLWNTVRDWRPLWEFKSLTTFLGSIYTFIGIVCTSMLLVAVHLTKTLLRRRPTQDNGTTPAQNLDAFPIMLFDIALVMVAVVMAVSANRFVPIALVAVAPLLGRELVWAMHALRKHWLVPGLMSALLCFYGVVITTDNIRNYDPNNPFINTGGGSFFEQMHWVNTLYSPRLIDFVNLNWINGNVNNPYDWEGYLRWNCPQLPLFIGGRAQQVYTEKVFGWHIFLNGTDVPQFSGAVPEEMLNQMGSHLIITGNSEESFDLIFTALSSGNWAIIYADMESFIFVDTTWSATRKFAEQMVDGQLRYPTPAIQAMSEAAFVLSQPAYWKTKPLFELFSEVYKTEATWLWSYRALFNSFQSDAELFRKAIALLENQLAHLETLPVQGPQAASLLYCRYSLSDMLYQLTSYLKQDSLAQKHLASKQQAAQLTKQLKKRWQQTMIN